jgi:hypothetical protein
MTQCRHSDHGVAPLNASVDDRPERWRLLFAPILSLVSKGSANGKEAKILLSELYRVIFLDCGDFNEIRPF